MKTVVKKRIAFAFVAVAIVAVAAYLIPGKQAPAIQAMGCQDIVKGCSGDGLAVRLDQAPQVMRPFKLEVSAPEADSVEASFSMAGMEMGFNRYRLIKQGDQLWDADVTLPVCVRNRKDWLLLLDIKEGSDRRQVAIAFRSE